jgi:transposase-like protein
METPTNIVRLRQPDDVDDPRTDVLRAGARRLLAQAVELEAEAFLASMRELKLLDGRDRLVKHGHGPERLIQTGIGPVAVARVKIRDRGAASGEDRIRFSSALLPRWARRTRSLAVLLPVLYLRGVSTGDLQEALAALLGRDAPNLSPSVIARLTAEWQAEDEHWQRRDLSARSYVYIWADGGYLQARMEEHAECMLVLMGATPEGRKELVGFQVGVRESTQSWREFLIEVKRRGLTIAPELAVGDGALGFWKALDEIYPGTRHQRCWLHKSANVLNKVPKAVQIAMKADLREIQGAPTRAAAEAAIDIFAEKYGAKYARAVECLTKDRAALLAFYAFPAEHWDHLRTSRWIASSRRSTSSTCSRTCSSCAGCRATSARITARSSWPRGFSPGSRPWAPRQRTSSGARPGRTATWNRLRLGFGTSCWMGRSSPLCGKQIIIESWRPHLYEVGSVKAGAFDRLLQGELSG